MKLEVMSNICSLYKIDENREVPRTIYQSSFFSVTKTDQELTIICDSSVNLSCCSKLSNLKLIRIEDASGVNSTETSLRSGDIPFFGVSTYGSDYIILEERYLKSALTILSASGADFS